LVGLGNFCKSQFFFDQSFYFLLLLFDIKMSEAQNNIISTSEGQSQPRRLVPQFSLNNIQQQEQNQASAQPPATQHLSHNDQPSKKAGKST
jgi:hypothetical protein